eukprot:TRINITY_DN14522_c0_g1_i1.p2 TRINITY_DN14522_c0_g1~~TRINITY_DN14522_c0_g1_i1.p2  ORF type:complete len:125 (+),score=21.65 TRINITY_DN14522_c0_g1_i1:164-538(+)
MAVEPAGANGTVRAAAAADEPATKRPKTEVEPPKAAAPISEAALQNTPWPVFVEGSSDFGSAGDGWWAHKGGEWLFNREDSWSTAGWYPSEGSPACNGRLAPLAEQSQRWACPTRQVGEAEVGV